MTLLDKKYETKKTWHERYYTFIESQLYYYSTTVTVKYKSVFKSAVHYYN